MKKVIEARGLSKSFLISHQEKERYTLFRDVVADRAKRFFSFGSGSAAKGSGPGMEEFWALKDLDFDVHKGERIGFIGKNGAGKSTLLKVISRIIEPTSGTVKIRGRVASLLEVGTGFHPELSGRENIYLNGAILGMSRKEIQKKFDEIVAFAEVEKFLDTPVKRYSSGMHVRLAFAVAAHLDPEILLIDEVLAVGDSQFQKKCIGKMEDVNREEGRTILFVSHNMGIVHQFCQRAILLEQGKITAMGPAEGILDKYLTGLQSMSSEYRVDQATALRKPNHFTHISLGNESGIKAVDFSFHERMVLDFEFCLNNPMSNIHIGVVLCDKYQSRIFTVMQPIDFFRPKGKIYRGRVRIPASLIAPNIYSYSFFITENTGEIHDHVENVCYCQIHDAGSSMSHIEGFEMGCVVVNPEWEAC